MKKYIYLENDNDKKGMEDLEICLMILSNNKIEIDIDEVEFIDRLWEKNLLELLERIVENKQMILTHSTYIPYIANGKAQLKNALHFIGRNYISGLTYINTTYQLPKTVSSIIEDSEDKALLSIIGALERNNIVSNTDNGLKRVKFQYNLNYNYVKLEDYKLEI
jgi:hypothetical protein